MTRMYNGGGEYTLTFDSGLVLTLSEREYDEIVTQSGLVEELQEEYKESDKSLQSIHSDIEKQSETLRELSSILDELITQIKEVKRTKQREKLLAIMDDSTSIVEEVESHVSEYL